MQIRKTREGWYVITAAVQFAVFFSLVYFHEVFVNDKDGWLDTIVNIGKGYLPFVVISLAHSLIAIEGVTMLAERYLRGRFREGIEQGTKETNQRWEEWNKRREEAERERRPFNEPTPSSQDASASEHGTSQ